MRIRLFVHFPLILREVLIISTEKCVDKDKSEYNEKNKSDNSREQ